MGDDIVTRLRQEHVVGWIHPAGECVTCDAADEIERLRAAGDALDAAMREVSCSGSADDIAHLMDASYAWQEARRG